MSKKQDKKDERIGMWILGILLVLILGYLAFGPGHGYNHGCDDTGIALNADHC